MNEKYNKMNYRRYNETNTRTNGTGNYQNDTKLNDRTDSAEFPSLRLYKIGTYVHKSFLQYPDIRKTDLIKRNIIWAKIIYNLGRIMYPDLLPAAFRLNNLSYKPDVRNIVRSRKTSSFEADETLMEDATFLFPDAKDLGVALTICKRILKIPIRERTEDQIGRLEWAMEVLDVSDDMVTYLLKLIEQISKTEAKKEYTNTTQVKEPTVSVKTVESINNKATNQNVANKAGTTAASTATTSATKANSTGANSTTKSSTVTTKANSTSAKITASKENSTAANNAGNISKMTKANSTSANTAGNTSTATKANSGSSTTATETNSTSGNTAGNTSTAAKTNSKPSNSTGNTSTATKANSTSANSAGNTSTANKANSTSTNSAGNTSTANKTNSTSANTTGNISTATKTNSKPSNSAGNTSTENKANSISANSAGNTSTLTKTNSTSANTAGNTSTATKANSTSANSAGNTSTANKANSTSTNSAGNTSTANKTNSTSANSAGNTSTVNKANSSDTFTVTMKSSTAAATASSTSTVTEAKLASESSTSTTTTTATKVNSTETISTTANSASTTTVTSVSSSTPSSTSTTSTATKANTVATSSTTATAIEAVTFTYAYSTKTTKNFAATSASIMSNLAKARAASSNVPKTAGSKKKKNAAQQTAPTPPISNKCTIPVLISSADTARFPKSTPVVNEPKPGSNPHVLIGLNANAQKGNPRAPLMYNIPAVNRPYPAPMQPIRPPPRPQMCNFPQQTHPMYRPPAPYPVQAPMNNFQPRPYMYNHPPAPAVYQPQPQQYMGPAMPQQYQMQHNYQEYYNYNNNAAAPNMPYPAMQQPNYYEPSPMTQPQPLAPPSAMESNHHFYDANAYNSTAANMPEPVPPPPPMTKSATRTTQNRPKERDKASRASTSKASTSKTSSTTKKTIDTTPTSTKSFQTRKNIEDFVNPSNPLSNKLSKILSDSLPEYIINKQTIDLSAFGEESTFNAKRRRLIEEGLISVPEEPKEPIVVGLVDHNAPNGIISQANWSFIQNRLQTTLLELLKDDPGSFPNGLDAGWHQGRIKLFAFPNQRSLQLFKRAIYTLGDLWPGARITVEPQSSLPHRPRYRTYIPAAPSDPATILKIIQVSNPNLPTHDWEVVQVDNEKKKQRCACLVLNAESFEPLLEQGMIITYGFGCIRLKIFKQDKLPHEREALQDKNRGKLNQVTMSYRKRAALERDRAEIEREYRNSCGEKRMREDELTSKLAEDILQHLDQIMDESTFNVSDEGAEYRDWY